ncbi:MAG: hypothetical protein ACRES7_06315 [Gammaproteobacteria bacterium]
MTLLPIIALAAGLNMATPSAPAVPEVQQAQVRLDRLINAAEPALRERSLESIRNENRAALEDAVRVAADARMPALEDAGVNSVQTALDRLVGGNELRLRARALNAAQAEDLSAFNQALSAELNSAQTVAVTASGAIAPKAKAAGFGR